MAVKRKQKQYEFKSLKGALSALLITVFSVLILAVAYVVLGMIGIVDYKSNK